jgi:hypothetical protein
MGKSVYRPGDIVPCQGVYRITHHLHRLMHEATLTAGMKFPVCRQCGNKVRFSLVRAVRTGVIPFRSTEILEEYPQVKKQSAG